MPLNAPHHPRSTGKVKVGSDSSHPSHSRPLMVHFVLESQFALCHHVASPLGEMGLIEDRPRSLTVKALTEIKVMSINRDRFNELLSEDPSILVPVMKSLFERLRQFSEISLEGSGAAAMGPDGEKAFDVVMEGQTVEAKAALADSKRRITKFPFLIGRDSRKRD
ncbi:MAG: cyclic nucleotide-binding domain-containing protein, partial [Pseudomonadota bacterium]